MSQGSPLLGADILPQGGAQKAAFQVVGGQSVPRQEGVDIAPADQGSHGVPAAPVKDAGGAQNPGGKTVIPFVLQKLCQAEVIGGVAGFPAPALAKSEGLPFSALPAKAGGMEIDALAAVLGAAQGHQIPLAEVPELHCLHPAVLPENQDGVHPAVLRQKPAAFYAEVFGVDGGGVVVFRGDAVPGGGGKGGVLGFCEGGGRKVRRGVGREGKRHGGKLLSGKCLPFYFII